MNIEQLFFELIRIAIGTQDTLSRAPSAKEWKLIYDIAKKQSLVGICFAGVQKLGEGGVETSETLETSWNLPELLYLTWMGMAAKIQQRNEVVNRQCVELQQQLLKDGFRSCILKGQGVAAAYGCLSLLRQSGDIDAWVDAPKEQVIAWTEKVGMTEEPGYLHVGCKVFSDTEVELHYRPTYCRCLWYNKRLQEFCEEHKNSYEVRGGIVVPSWEFDMVYQLSHIYRHLFGLGIGFRQLMDYYWTLSNSPTSTCSAQRLKGENTDLQDTLKHLGLYDFAGTVMYVLREVFIGNDNDNLFLGIKPDEKRGKMLLRLVMQTGNFGHLDDRQKEARGSALGTMRYKLSQWWELLRFYPEETLSAPLWCLIRKFD